MQTKITIGKQCKGGKQHCNHNCERVSSFDPVYMGKYRWPRWRNVWCIFNLVLTCKGTSLPKIWTYVSLWMLAGGTAHINPWTGVNEHPGKLQWDKLCRNTSTSFPSYLSSSQSWICHGSIKLVFCQGSCWPKTLNPPSPSSNYKNLTELGRCDRKQHLGWVIFDSLLKITWDIYLQVIVWIVKLITEYID